LFHIEPDGLAGDCDAEVDVSDVIGADGLAGIVGGDGVEGNPDGGDKV